MGCPAVSTPLRANEVECVIKWEVTSCDLEWTGFWAASPLGDRRTRSVADGRLGDGGGGGDARHLLGWTRDVLLERKTPKMYFSILLSFKNEFY